MPTAKKAPRLVALTALLLASCASSSRVELPEMRLRVIDGSDNPVAGIPVWYGVETELYRPPILGVVPHIDGYIGSRFFTSRTVITPASGEVVLPGRVLQLPRQEYFRYERLYVNADVDTTRPEARRAREILEDECRRGGPTCPPERSIRPIEIAAYGWLVADRARVLRPRDRRYRVVEMLVMEPDPERLELFRARDEDPVFVTRAVGFDLSQPRTIVIELPALSRP